MARRSVFHNLVSNENSATELLCNAMRFDALRSALLTLFFSDTCASKVTADDIDTQITVGRGQPDLVIDNDEVYAFIEVKVERHCGLTPYQPDGYYECLREDKSKRPERWLVFLVPSRWDCRPRLEDSLRRLDTTHVGSGVKTNIIQWGAVLDVLQNVSVRDEALRPLLNEVTTLFSSWFLPRQFMFSKENVRTLFSKDFAVTFADLMEFIKEVGVQGGKLCKCSQRGWEGLYFKSEEGENLLWFGFWPDFWRTEGLPIAFGVQDDWPEWVQESFRVTYGHETKKFGGWTVGWLSPEDFESSNPLEKALERIEPLLRALRTANASTT
jgi:hypothetical protein